MSKMSALHPWHRLFYVGGNLQHPVILGKGGQLSAVIAFAGRDVRNAPDHEVYMSTSTMDNIRADFAKEEGFYFHDDMTTAPAEYLRAPWFLVREDNAETHVNQDATGVVRLLDEHRAQRHSRLVEPVIFMTVSMQPPQNGTKLFKSILDGFPIVKDAPLRIDATLAEFNTRVENLVTTLNGRIGRARRLDAHQIYQYTFYCQTGVWLDIEAPKESGVTFGKLFDVERIDDKRGNAFAVKAAHAGIVHVRVATPHGMPPRVRAEFFENMCFFGGGVRWVSRMILVPANHIRKQYTDEWYREIDSVKSLRQMMRSKMTGSDSGIADPVQQDRADQAREDVRGTASALYGVHLVQSVVIYRNSAEDADKAAAAVAEAFINMKKLCDVEDLGTKTAVSASMPGQVKWNVSRDTLPNNAAMTQIPISLPNTGPDVRGGMDTIKIHAAHQFTIRNMFPARVDFGNGQNRHSAMTAPVRVGKSTTIQKIIQGILARTNNPFVFMLDVNVEQSASGIACRAMGGSVLSFTTGTCAIQPLRHIDVPERREVAVRWIRHCIRAHGLDDKNPMVLRRIEEGLTQLARIPENFRTVEQYQAIVQDHVVKQCLTPFATGIYAPHVGGNRNVLGIPPYVVVDCTGLTIGDHLASVVVAALLDEIQFAVLHHQGPVQLFIDEAAQVLPLIGDSIDGAYRRWPKQGGGITIVIHNPSDLDACGATGNTIKQNTAAWVCLADAGARDNLAYAKYVQLNDFQIACIAEMKRGEFLLKTSDEVRVIQTDLSELERWVLGQGGKEAAALAGELSSATTADEFAVQLLRKGGFNDEADQIVAASCNAAYSIAAE